MSINITRSPSSRKVKSAYESVKLPDALNASFTDLLRHVVQVAPEVANSSGLPSELVQELEAHLIDRISEALGDVGLEYRRLSRTQNTLQSLASFSEHSTA